MKESHYLSITTSHVSRATHTNHANRATHASRAIRTGRTTHMTCSTHNVDAVSSGPLYSYITHGNVLYQPNLGLDGGCNHGRHK